MKSIQNAIFVFLFCAVVAGVYLWVIGDLKFTGNSDPSETAINNTGFLKTPAEFRRKLAELRMDQDKVKRRKQLLLERKQETVDFLKEKGVTSDSDLTDKDVKYAVHNLKRYVADTKNMDTIIARYNEPIAAIEAMLQRLEQERIAEEVAISDERAMELGKMLIDLDEKLSGDELDVLEVEELRDMLDLELNE